MSANCTACLLARQYGWPHNALRPISLARANKLPLPSLYSAYHMGFSVSLTRVRKQRYSKFQELYLPAKFSLGLILVGDYNVI